jgi:hypothetical protein
MKYKVGDKVKIKSIDWYNENKDKNGIVNLITSSKGTFNFIRPMARLCGKVVTIMHVGSNFYDILEDSDYCWTDEMIEGLVEDETSIKLTGKAIKNDEMVVGIGEWNLPQGYQFKDENGNIINTTKIVLEKIKKEYPKTYEECCKILLYSGNYNMILTTDVDNKIFDALYRLKVCRDAYWKIYGKEMKLGKSWKPDWTKADERKYCIVNTEGNITKWVQKTTNKILAFPTEEMRDAFKENFDPDIEKCKEFL